MGYVVEQVSLAGGPALAIRVMLPMAELPAFFGGAFSELGEVAHRAGAHAAAMPFARYASVSREGVDVEVVMPLDRPVVGAGRVRAVVLAGGPAAQVKHVGPYQALAPAYAALTQWLTEHHAKAGDLPREVYLTDPVSVPEPAKWETLVVQPLVPLDKLGVNERPRSD